MSPEEHQDRMGFREWTTHYEKEQETDRNKINDLTTAVSTINQSVGALTADVRTLIENQRITASRLNKPANWGIFGTFAAVIFMVVGLVVTDIKDNITKIENHQALDITRDLELHMWFRNSIDNNNEALASNQTDLNWLKKMESRINRRFHHEAEPKQE